MQFIRTFVASFFYRTNEFTKQTAVYRNCTMPRLRPICRGSRTVSPSRALWCSPLTLKVACSFPYIRRQPVSSRDDTLEQAAAAAVQRGHRNNRLEPPIPHKIHCRPDPRQRTFYRRPVKIHKHMNHFPIGFCTKQDTGCGAAAASGLQCH